MWSIQPAATGNQILVNLVYHCVLATPRFSYPVEEPYSIDYELEFLQAEPV